MKNLNDQDFVLAFEKGTLAASEFHHTQHIRLAWIYLQNDPLPEVLIKVREGIKNFAARLGKADLYHETITFMFVFLIHQRMQRQGPRNWEDFCKENPDLFQWNPSLLDQLYSQDILKSAEAKASFLWPNFNK